MTDLEKMIQKNPVLEKMIKKFHLLPELETNKNNNQNQKTETMAKRKEKQSSLFLQVVAGKLAKYSETPNEYTEQVKSKDGTIRNYEMFESVSGKLKQVYVYDKELSDDRSFEMLAIKVLNNDGEFEVITVPFKSNYAKSFIARLGEINLDKDVEIKAFKIEDKEKSKAKGKQVFNEMLLPYQDGKTIENPYKKDGKKKMPEVKKDVTKLKGVSTTKYDFSEQEEFLRELVKASNELIREKNNIAPMAEESNADDDLPVDFN